MASKKKPRQYGVNVAATVEKVMHERNDGTLRSGRSKKKVTSRKQAIAIGLSEARAAGKKVPAPRPAKKRGAKKTVAKKSAAKTRAA